MKLNLSKEGYEAYKTFRKKINDTINNEKNDAISGIYSKIDTYSLGIPLILYGLSLQVIEKQVSRNQVEMVVEIEW